jgi:hypothetical protein
MQPCGSCLREEIGEFLSKRQSHQQYDAHELDRCCIQANQGLYIEISNSHHTVKSSMVETEYHVQVSMFS